MEQLTRNKYFFFYLLGQIKLIQSLVEEINFTLLRPQIESSGRTQLVKLRVLGSKQRINPVKMASDFLRLQLKYTLLPVLL